MNKVKCLNCENEQGVVDKGICYDELGSFVACKGCGSSYDITLKGESVKMIDEKINYYDIEVVFYNGQTQTYTEEAETSFEAIKQLLNNSKGAIREDIRDIRVQ